MPVLSPEELAKARNPDPAPEAETEPVVEEPPPAPLPAPTPPPSPLDAVKRIPRKILLIGGGIFLVLLVIIITLSSSGSKQKAPETNTTANETLQPTLIPERKIIPDFDDPEAFARMVVYGTWSGQTSSIKAVELSSQKTSLLVSLPSAIKRVSVLSPETLMYIDKTDARDHGKQVVIYSLKTKAPLGSIPATPGFGIDEYVLSPDKKFLAIWEVSFAPKSQVLQGGKSRVYAVDLRRPSVKRLLYDEVAKPTEPIHYPRAILDNGRVFADKFLPNDPKGGVGWAYGLSVVDFDGTNRQDLPLMQAGTYGTQPSLSPDGKYLVFSGYDGTRGDGKTLAGGYRRALLTPNTVELLDTETFARQKLPDLDNNNSYTSSEWDASTGRIILTIVSAENVKLGVYSYDLDSKALVKINVPATDNTTYGFLTELTNSTILVGTQDTNSSNLGNLGDGYAFPFTQIALFDEASQKISYTPLEDTFAQYITVLPEDYFKGVLGVQALAQAMPKPTFVDFFSGQNAPKKGQQLHTFLVKYDLSPNRLKQQSTPLYDLPESSLPPGFALPPPGFKQNKDSPKCEDLAEEQCSAQGTATAGEGSHESCVKTNKLKNLTGAKFEGKCHDSPLYLYGEEGQQVQVTIQTPISRALPSSTNGSYTVTLGKDGKFDVNGTSYSSIAYDYIANKKRISAPQTGTVVKRNDIEKTLKEYAVKLGLNEKETADLVAAGKQKTSGPYVFVSFFNQETSEQILPIAFTPKPDNYLNIVFYFKNLASKPAYTPLPPVFPAPLERTGFTAVEISEMVE